MHLDNLRDQLALFDLEGWVDNKMGERERKKERGKGERRACVELVVVPPRRAEGNGVELSASVKSLV